MNKNNLFLLSKNDEIPFVEKYSLVASGDLPQWFLKFRRQGIESYIKNYSLINPDVVKFFCENDFSVLKFDDFPTFDMMLKYPMLDIDAYTIVLVNGKYCEELSSEDEFPFSVFSDGIVGVVNDYPELLEKRLKCDDNALVALNSAYFSNGIVIDIADGEKLLKPIHIVSIVSCDEKNFINPRVIVNVGNNVSVDIIESNFSVDEKYFENRVCQFFIGKNSVVNDYKYYSVSGNSLMVENNFFDVKDGAKLNQIVFSKNAGAFYNYFNFNMGIATNLDFVSSVYGKKKENFNVDVSIKHFEDNSKSKASLFGVADENSKIYFTTSVECSKNVNNIDTKQISKIILNSDNALGRIKPLQNIYSEGVKAYHGAVVSGIKVSDLFFLESRGMKKNEAELLILKSYLANILQNIHNEKIYDTFYNLIWL